MGTREADPVLAQARIDIAAARASIASAGGQKDQLKAAQLYQDASQRLQAVVDNLQARLQSGKDSGGRIRALLTSVLLEKAQVDRELKNYDASIVSLTAVIRQDPDRFDQANGQIREIIGIREKYAQIATDLFTVIKTKDMSLPANQDYVKQRTIELQNLDPYGNQDILIKISEAILKSQNLRAMRDIMTRARALLDAGRFADAFAAYQKGFDIYRQSYENAGYDLLDEQSGRVLVAGADGTLTSRVVSPDGTVLRTDRSGEVMKSPDGAPLPMLDAQGRAQKLTFLLSGGRKRLEAGEGGVVEYAESIVSNAVSLADSVRDASGGLSALAPAVQSLRSAFVAGDPAAVEAAWQPLRDALTELDRVYMEMDRAGKRLADLDQQLPKKRGAADLSYVQYAYPSYADLFIRGRPPVADYGRIDSFGDPSWRPVAERDKPEGLAGTMLSEYGSLLDGLQSAFEPVLDNDYRSAEASLDAQKWDEAKTAFDRLAKLSDQAMRVLDLWKEAYSTDPDANLSDQAKSIVDRKASDSERVRRLGELAAGYSRVAQLAMDLQATTTEGKAFLAGLPPNPPFASAYAAFVGFHDRFEEIELRIHSIRLDNDGLVAKMTQWAGTAPGDARASQALEVFSKRVKNMESMSHEQLKTFVLLATSLLTKNLAVELPARMDAVQGAEAAIAGAESNLPDRSGLRDPTPAQILCY